MQEPEVQESQERINAQSCPGPICAVCHSPIEICDYSGQILNPTHEVNLTIIAMVGDAFLPHVLEVHGDCLKDLREQIIEKNKGCTWR